MGKKEVSRKFFNENGTNQNLWDTAKAEAGGTLMAQTATSEKR